MEQLISRSQINLILSMLSLHRHIIHIGNFKVTRTKTARDRYCKSTCSSSFVTRRSLRLPDYRPCLTLSPVVVMPSLATLPDYRHDRTSPPSSPRSCQLVARPKSRPNVETSTRPAPLQVDRPDPEGQQRHSTCRSVEARNRTWPWSVATAQAGYA